MVALPLVTLPLPLPLPFCSPLPLLWQTRHWQFAEDAASQGAPEAAPLGAPEAAPLASSSSELESVRGSSSSHIDQAGPSNILVGRLRSTADARAETATTATINNVCDYYYQRLRLPPTYCTILLVVFSRQGLVRGHLAHHVRTGAAALQQRRNKNRHAPQSGSGPNPFNTRRRSWPPRHGRRSAGSRQGGALWSGQRRSANSEQVPPTGQAAAPSTAAQARSVQQKKYLFRILDTFGVMKTACKGAPEAARSAETAAPRPQCRPQPPRECLAEDIVGISCLLRILHRAPQPCTNHTPRKRNVAACRIKSAQTPIADDAPILGHASGDAELGTICLTKAVARSRWSRSCRLSAATCANNAAAGRSTRANFAAGPAVEYERLLANARFRITPARG